MKNILIGSVAFLCLCSALASIMTTTYSGVGSYVSPYIVPFTTYHDDAVTVRGTFPTCLGYFMLKRASDGIAIDYLTMRDCSINTTCTDPTVCSTDWACTNETTWVRIHENLLPAGNWYVEFNPDTKGKKVPITVIVTANTTP